MISKNVIPPEQLPGMNRLAADYCTHAPAAAGFFAGDFSRPEAWLERAVEVGRADHADRGRVIAALRRQLDQLEAGPQSMANLELLASPDALAIVTGQQAGLFGGPLYTLYKALTTCKLARHWSEQRGKPVVPVFYVVSEDHDFVEVQGAGYLEGGHILKKALYSPSSLRERMPVGLVRLEAEIDAVLAELAGSVPEAEFKAEVIADLASCYHPGAGFAGAFSRWYARLLGELGMVFLDPADPELKRLAAPIFRRELEKRITVERIEIANTELLAGGYHTQLPVHPLRPALFLLRDGRHSLERTGNGYRNLHSGEILAIDELMAAPEQLSPKAALRPLFEDYLLPTLAYVGGPGEIAYWAQLKGVYAGFGLPMPMVVPRAGFTLVEGRSRRALERFGIAAAEVVQRPTEILAALRERLVPADLAGELAELKAMIGQRWPRLQGGITALDQTLQVPAEKSLQQLMHTLNQLEQKVVRAAENRESAGQAQIDALTAALLPGGILQERQLNAVPFFCRHGRGLIGELYEAIDAANPGHSVVEL